MIEDGWYKHVHWFKIYIYQYMVKWKFLFQRKSHFKLVSNMPRCKHLGKNILGTSIEPRQYQECCFLGEKRKFLTGYTCKKSCQKWCKWVKTGIVFCTFSLTGGGGRGQSSWLEEVKVEEVKVEDTHNCTFCKKNDFSVIFLFWTGKKWKRSKFMIGGIFLHWPLWRNHWQCLVMHGQATLSRCW